MDEKDALFYDIKATEILSTELAKRDEPTATKASAIERGVRQHPDGVTEQYERIEFS
jgi:hypothetical protein